MATLKRHFGFTTLLIYGVGDILGAGIYALIGKVAGASGTNVWLSFAVAMSVALLTAFSYAELCARFPKSGGVSYFTEQAFSQKWIAFISGWVLTWTCIFSIATLGIAFVGYLSDFDWSISKYIIIFVFLSVLGLINIKGIQHSSTANVIATAVEVSGLLFVIYVAFQFLGESRPEVASTPLNEMKILEGAALAFFAFIGFEDLANVAEEVKKPEKNLPKAIISAVLITGCFYVLIAWLSTSVVQPQVLAQSEASLAEVIKVAGYQDFLTYFSLIALFAVSNTCLLNSVTASRLLYGMSEQKLMPKFLGHVHEKFQTPYFAAGIVLIVAYGLTFLGDLKQLAGVTSFLVLITFTLTNISLIIVKLKDKKTKVFKVPLVIPIFAALSNVALMVFIPLESSTILLAVIIVGLVASQVLVRNRV